MALTVRRWTLAGRLRAALGGLLLVLVVAGLAVVVSLRAADRALSQQTERAFPARVAASQLLTSLVDQETGLRGFAITKDPTFLEPYETGLDNEKRARARLEQVVPSGDPARVALLTVDAAITAWRDEYASLRTTSAGSGDAAVTIAFGRELFDRVRASNAALDAKLARQIKEAQQAADRDRTIVLLVLAGMGLALLGAVVALQRALVSSVLRPMVRLRAQVAVVSGGEHRTPIRPEGPPDLQEMGAGVESMRLELVRALAEVEEKQRDVERRAAELARSNADLEQFAYVASHDLQEPLRKVASFCQLIEQRYSGQLDERGEQYIAFAVDGAKRMQRLITDLLAFSRVGRTSSGFERVDLAAVVGRSTSGLESRIEETRATVHVDVPEPLEVQGDPSLLQVLVTNLLGNALKYHRDDTPPEVRVTATADGDLIRLRVADNGIGIPDEYADKVFVIFQRLHGRDEYEGTGIGLALVKRIAEFHEGSVALEPSPLGGACVCVTLPAAVPAAIPTHEETTAGV